MDDEKAVGGALREANGDSFPAKNGKGKDYQEGDAQTGGMDKAPIQRSKLLYVYLYRTGVGSEREIPAL